MKTSLVLFVSILLSAGCLSAQSDSKPTEAPVDMEKARALIKKKREGVTLSVEERAYLERAIKERQKNRGGATKEDPTTGDNLASRGESHVPGIAVSEKVSPVKEVALKSADGLDLSFAYRAPSGEGPHPVILFFHGGGDYARPPSLKKDLLDKPIQTRFLEQGFVIVQSTRRPYWENTKTKVPNGFYRAVDDTVKIVDKVKTLPEVDPDKVVLFGGSGGGILAIVTGSKTDVSCVIAGEPATVVPLDPKTGERGGSRAYQAVMEKPKDYFQGERKEEMLEWMNAIDAPILILQGKPVGLYKANFEFLIPEMKKLGKDISSITYPGTVHGFYWGKVKSGATPELTEQMMKDMKAFIGKQLQ